MYKDKSDPRYKESRRKHYQNNKQLYKDRAHAKTKELTDYVRELKNNPCTDCGMSYPHYVMEFDHITDDKIMNISILIKYGNRAKLDLEIAKCELVCANCHRERTHQRIIQ